MSVEGTQPVAAVRVFVTYRALAQIDPSKLEDLAGAFETFDANRTKIEFAASRHYDTSGVDGGDTHDGQPVITLSSRELFPVTRQRLGSASDRK